MPDTPIRLAAALLAGLVTALHAAGQSQSPGSTDPRKDDPSGTSIYDSLRLDIPLGKKPEDFYLPTQTKRVVARGKRLAHITGLERANLNGVAQNPLPQCRLDASAMGAVLSAAGYDCTVLSDTGLATSKPSTVAGYLASLSEVCDRAGPDDQVLVYVSTHGGFIDGSARVILSDGAVEVNEIKRLLSGSRALVRMLILDCCRGDAGFAPVTSEFRDIHTLLACRPDELSATGPNMLSVFTEVFVDALVDCGADRFKDGELELVEILRFLDQEVPERAKRYDPTASQNPTFSVVDPKAVNPIVASCEPGTDLAPTAFEGVPGEFTAPVGGRREWFLTGLYLLPTISEGMTHEEMVRRMKREPDHVPAAGEGAAIYENEPREGDALVVEFAGGVVSSVRILLHRMCESGFDAAESRARLNAIASGDAALPALFERIKGKSVREVQDLLGCANDSLIAPDGLGDGVLRYPGLPRPSQALSIVFDDGAVVDIQLIANLP